MIFEHAQQNIFTKREKNYVQKLDRKDVEGNTQKKLYTNYLQYVQWSERPGFKTIAKVKKILRARD